MIVSFSSNPLEEPAMNEILRKEVLAEKIKKIEVRAPEIAAKVLPGQFVVLRINEQGERIPLTVQQSDNADGTINLIFLEVGKTTINLGELEEGDAILNLAGPLGTPSEIENYGTTVIIGGGIGLACALPVAKALKEAGNYVISIIGARTKDLLVLEDDFRYISNELYITPDDGSYGRKGYTVMVLQDLLGSGKKIDYVYSVGPVVMMRSVANTTREHSVKTVVSLNPIMVDATGMCGGCRVEIGGETKFACIEGPEFDAHQVDFDLLMKRQRYYHEEEECSLYRTGA
jgi:ferredoxin--NADP+ reductase